MSDTSTVETSSSSGEKALRVGSLALALVLFLFALLSAYGAVFNIGGESPAESLTLALILVICGLTQLHHNPKVRTFGLFLLVIGWTSSSRYDLLVRFLPETAYIEFDLFRYAATFLIGGYFFGVILPLLQRQPRTVQMICYVAILIKLLHLGLPR